MLASGPRGAATDDPRKNPLNLQICGFTVKGRGKQRPAPDDYRFCWMFRWISSAIESARAAAAVSPFCRMLDAAPL